MYIFSKFYLLANILVFRTRAILTARMFIRWNVFPVKSGGLKRISAQVDPDLEIAEILRRTMYAKGPAILFENVKGYDMPVLGNAFGSEKMLQIGLEMEDFTEIGSRIVDMTRWIYPLALLENSKNYQSSQRWVVHFQNLKKADL